MVVGFLCYYDDVFMHGQHGIGDKFRFSTFCFQYAIYLLQFLLSVIPEPKKKRDYSMLTEVREYDVQNQFSRLGTYWVALPFV